MSDRAPYDHTRRGHTVRDMQSSSNSTRMGRLANGSSGRASAAEAEPAPCHRLSSGCSPAPGTCNPSCGQVLHAGRFDQRPRAGAHGLHALVVDEPTDPLARSAEHMRGVLDTPPRAEVFHRLRLAFLFALIRAALINSVERPCLRTSTNRLLTLVAVPPEWKGTAATRLLSTSLWWRFGGAPPPAWPMSSRHSACTELKQYASGAVLSPTS